jgi:hypothetical protein
MITLTGEHLKKYTVKELKSEIRDIKKGFNYSKLKRNENNRG